MAKRISIAFFTDKNRGMNKKTITTTTKEIVEVGDEFSYGNRDGETLMWKVDEIISSTESVGVYNTTPKPTNYKLSISRIQKFTT